MNNSTTNKSQTKDAELEEDASGCNSHPWGDDDVSSICRDHVLSEQGQDINNNVKVDGQVYSQSAADLYREREILKSGQRVERNQRRFNGSRRRNYGNDENSDTWTKRSSPKVRLLRASKSCTKECDIMGSGHTVARQGWSSQEDSNSIYRAIFNGELILELTSDDGGSFSEELEDHHTMSDYINIMNFEEQTDSQENTEVHTSRQDVLRPSSVVIHGPPDSVTNAQHLSQQRRQPRTSTPKGVEDGESGSNQGDQEKETDLLDDDSHSVTSHCEELGETNSISIHLNCSHQSSYSSIHSSGRQKESSVNNNFSESNISRRETAGDRSNMRSGDECPRGRAGISLDIDLNFSGQVYSNSPDTSPEDTQNVEIITIHDKVKTTMYERRDHNDVYHDGTKLDGMEDAKTYDRLQRQPTVSLVAKTDTSFHSGQANVEANEQDVTTNEDTLGTPMLIDDDDHSDGNEKEYCGQTHGFHQHHALLSVQDTQILVPTTRNNLSIPSLLHDNIDPRSNKSDSLVTLSEKDRVDLNTSKPKFSIDNMTNASVSPRADHNIDTKGRESDTGGLKEGNSTKTNGENIKGDYVRPSEYLSSENELGGQKTLLEGDDQILPHSNHSKDNATLQKEESNKSQKNPAQLSSVKPGKRCSEDIVKSESGSSTHHTQDDSGRFVFQVDVDSTVEPVHTGVEGEEKKNIPQRFQEVKISTKINSEKREGSSPYLRTSDFLSYILSLKEEAQKEPKTVLKTRRQKRPNQKAKPSTPEHDSDNTSTHAKKIGHEDSPGPPRFPRGIDSPRERPLDIADSDVSQPTSSAQAHSTVKSKRPQQARKKGTAQKLRYCRKPRVKQRSSSVSKNPTNNKKNGSAKINEHISANILNETGEKTTAESTDGEAMSVFWNDKGTDITQAECPRSSCITFKENDNDAKIDAKESTDTEDTIAHENQDFCKVDTIPYEDLAERTTPKRALGEGDNTNVLYRRGALNVRIQKCCHCAPSILDQARLDSLYTPKFDPRKGKDPGKWNFTCSQHYKNEHLNTAFHTQKEKTPLPVGNSNEINRKTIHTELQVDDTENKNSFCDTDSSELRLTYLDLLHSQAELLHVKKEWNEKLALKKSQSLQETIPKTQNVGPRHVKDRIKEQNLAKRDDKAKVAERLVKNEVKKATSALSGQDGTTTFLSATSSKAYASTDDDDYWSSTVNSMLLRAEKVTMENEAQGDDHKFPRSDSARVVHPIRESGAAFLSHILEQDKQEQKQQRTSYDRGMRKEEKTKRKKREKRPQKKSWLHYRYSDNIPNEIPLHKLPAISDGQNLMADSNSSGVLKIKTGASRAAQRRAFATHQRMMIMKSVASTNKSVSLPKTLPTFTPIAGVSDFMHNSRITRLIPLTSTTQENPPGPAKTPYVSNENNRFVPSTEFVPWSKETNCMSTKLKCNYLLDRYSDVFQYYNSPYLKARQTSVVDLFARLNSNSNALCGTEPKNDACVSVSGKHFGTKDSGPKKSKQKRLRSKRKKIRAPRCSKISVPNTNVIDSNKPGTPRKVKRSEKAKQDKFLEMKTVAICRHKSVTLNTYIKQIGQSIKEDQHPNPATPRPTLSLKYGLTDDPDALTIEGSDMDLYTEGQRHDKYYDSCAMISSRPTNNMDTSLLHEVENFNKYAYSMPTSGSISIRTGKNSQPNQVETMYIGGTSMLDTNKGTFRCTSENKSKTSQFFSKYGLSEKGLTTAAGISGRYGNKRMDIGDNESDPVCCFERRASHTQPWNNVSENNLSKMKESIAQKSHLNTNQQFDNTEETWRWITEETRGESEVIDPTSEANMTWMTSNKFDNGMNKEYYMNLPLNKSPSAPVNSTIKSATRTVSISHSELRKRYLELGLPHRDHFCQSQRKPPSFLVKGTSIATERNESRSIKRMGLNTSWEPPKAGYEDPHNKPSEWQVPLTKRELFELYPPPSATLKYEVPTQIHSDNISLNTNKDLMNYHSDINVRKYHNRNQEKATFIDGDFKALANISQTKNNRKDAINHDWSQRLNQSNRGYTTSPPIEYLKEWNHLSKSESTDNTFIKKNHNQDAGVEKDAKIKQASHTDYPYSKKPMFLSTLQEPGSFVAKEFLRKLRGKDLLTILSIDSNHMLHGLKAVTRSSHYLPVFHVQSVQPAKVTPKLVRLHFCTDRLSRAANKGNRPSAQILRTSLIFYSTEQDDNLHSIYTVSNICPGLYSLEETALGRTDKTPARQTHLEPSDGNPSKVILVKLKQYSEQALDGSLQGGRIHIMGPWSQNKRTAINYMVHMAELLQDDIAGYFHLILNWPVVIRDRMILHGFYMKQTKKVTLTQRQLSLDNEEERVYNEHNYKRFSPELETLSSKLPNSATSLSLQGESSTPRSFLCHEGGSNASECDILEIDEHTDIQIREREHLSDWQSKGFAPVLIPDFIPTAGPPPERQNSANANTQALKGKGSLDPNRKAVRTHTYDVGLPTSKSVSLKRPQKQRPDGSRKESSPVSYFGTSQIVRALSPPKFYRNLPTKKKAFFIRRKPSQAKRKRIVRNKLAKNVSSSPHDSTSSSESEKDPFWERSSTVSLAKSSTTLASVSGLSDSFCSDYFKKQEKKLTLRTLDEKPASAAYRLARLKKMERCKRECEEKEKRQQLRYMELLRKGYQHYDNALGFDLDPTTETGPGGDNPLDGGQSDYDLCSDAEVMKEMWEEIFPSTGVAVRAK